MWEWISFSHRELCTTNCMYPGPWMHKSYGLSTSSWSILQICWLTSQQWTLVWNSATSSRFFFANSQQSKCTEKLVIFMYDNGWNTHFTDFDIVEEGDVPLLMSLPQMRNLGFQFDLTPEKAYLSCARIGMRKMVLKTAMSTHLILDLQDVAW